MSIFLLLGALAAGIGLAPDLPTDLPWPVLPFLSAAIWFFCRRFAAAPFFLALFCFSLGLVLYQLQIVPPSAPREISHTIGDEPTVVEGRVLAIGYRPESGSRIEVDAQRIVRGTKSEVTCGRLLLTVRLGTAECLPGDIIRFRARLRPPRLFQTPGEYDYPRKLAAAGIFVTASVEGPREIILLRASPAGPRRWLERCRAEVARFIHRTAIPRQPALVVALTTGDQSGINEELRQILTRGGVSHLFAISGQNLGLIAVGLVLLTTLVWRRFEYLLLSAPPLRVLPFLTAPAVILFFFWSGASVSALRALVMYLVVVIFLLFGRRTNPLHILATAAFAILLLQPASLFEPSFQLSFAGLAGIMMLVPPCQPHLAQLPGLFRWLTPLALATVAATLATLPFVLFHFHFIAPAGLVTNLAAVPLVGCVVVPLALLATLVLPFSPEIASSLFGGCGLLLDGMVALVDTITRWPGLSGFYFYTTPLRTFAVLLAVISVFFPWRRDWHICRVVTIGSALVLFCLPVPSPSAPALTVLSVGQGEALLLTLGDGQQLLVDGGGLYGTTFDTGERLVAPALGRLGIRKLDAVVMSHAHPDHAKGLAHILRNFPVAEFWCGEGAIIPPEIVAGLTLRGIPIRTFPPGWTVLPRPPEESLALFLSPHPATANDASLVILAKFGNDCVLLPGDLERPGIIELLRQTPSFPVAVIKIPHHGSRLSTPGLLLDHFSPGLAVVSAGAGNRFGFPHRETITVLSERRIPLWRTDLHGTLHFSRRGGEWRAERWKNGDFH